MKKYLSFMFTFFGIMILSFNLLLVGPTVHFAIYCLAAGRNLPASPNE